MSQEAPKPPLPPASPTHYVVLCGLCLGIIFLSQLQQGLFLLNVLAVMIGVLGLTSRLRIGPILLVAAVAGVQMYHHGQLGRFMAGGQTSFSLRVHELLLCIGVVGYVAAHYRLQAIWHYLWPEDARREIDTAPGPRRRTRLRPAREKRPGHQVTPLELVWFVSGLPLWALVGFLVWSGLSQRWTVVGFPPNFVRILFVVLFMAIVSFVARMAFDFWRHCRRDAVQARLFLQDVLWKETRGEQRRLNRWIVWWKNAF